VITAVIKYEKPPLHCPSSFYISCSLSLSFERLPVKDVLIILKN